MRVWTSEMALTPCVKGTHVIPENVATCATVGHIGAPCPCPGAAFSPVPLLPSRRLTRAQLIAAERFARKAGIGPLFRSTPPCSGYANGCICSACSALEAQIRERGFTPDGKVKPPAPVAQPWEPA